MRANNQRLILSLLRSHGPTAKAEIARLTGLSAQTASVIMRGLESDGLVERCDPVRGKVGQPLIPMRLAARGALFFGLKIGRRSADLVLIDFLGQVVSRLHLTYSFPTPDKTLNFVREGIEQLTNGLPARQRGQIAGLGIAIPFYLWEWSAVMGEPAENLAYWRDCDIRAEIAQLVDYPVLLENDASCACSAELVFGGPDHPADFLYVYIGYFLGGGLALGNRLFTGPGQNAAGALGPLPVPTNGEGQQPLLGVASLSRLEKMIVDAGDDSGALWESTSAWCVDATILDQWVDKAAQALAFGIVTSCSIINFELVLIDGWLSEQLRRDLVDRTAHALAQIDMTGLRPPKLREGTIGSDARSIGAASLPLSQHFLASQHFL